MTDTFWLRADNIAEIMPKVGQSIRAQVSAGKVIEVALKEAKKSKTRQQEKYLHACIGEIAKETGENAEHLKVRIKAQVGLIEEVWHKGKVLTIARSTSDLTRDEYGELIESVQALAGYLNIILPQPKDMGFYW